MVEITAQRLAAAAQSLKHAGQWAQACDLLGAAAAAGPSERAVLAVAAAEVCVDRDFWCLTTTADAASDPAARLISIGRAYVRWAVDHPDHYRVMFGADNDKAQHSSLAVAAGQAFGNLLDAITLCQAAGILHGQEPSQVAGPLWSLVHGIASFAIDGELHVDGVAAE